MSRASAEVKWSRYDDTFEYNLSSIVQLQLYLPTLEIQQGSIKCNKMVKVTGHQIIHTKKKKKQFSVYEPSMLGGASRTMIHGVSRGTLGC